MRGPERASADELSLSNREAAEASSMGGGASITSKRRALWEGLATPDRLGVAGPQLVPALSLPLPAVFSSAVSSSAVSSSAVSSSAVSSSAVSSPVLLPPRKGSGGSQPGADSSGRTPGLLAGNALEPQA